MKTKPNHFTTITAIFLAVSIFGGFSSQSVAARTCPNLFRETENILTEALPNGVLSSRFEVNQVTAVKIPTGMHPPEIRRAVGRLLRDKLRQFPRAEGGNDITVAINLSPKEFLHVASEGLGPVDHARLLQFITDAKLVDELRQIPSWCRNKYFQIKIPASRKDSGTIEIKFPWELKLAIGSQLSSGFGASTTAVVRPADQKFATPGDRHRSDLLGLQRSQETLATCGLSSLAQVLNARGFRISERELVDFAEHSGIKSVADLFGSEPGLGLMQLQALAQKLTARFGFKVSAKVLRAEADRREFFKWVEAASDREKGVDVIANYFSPVIGRPGAGHFSPVGGFNRDTKELMMSETNLVANPPFWVKADPMVEALTTPPDSPDRGYLVIEWPR